MFRLFTTDEGEVMLPFNLSGSLLAKSREWIFKGPNPEKEGWLPPPWLPHRWLVFSEKVQTEIDGSVVASSISSVPDMALLLFGNELELEEEVKGEEEGRSGADLVRLSMQQSFMSWQLIAAHTQAVLRVRRAMAKLLQRHLQEPCLLLRDEAYQLTARLQQLLADAAADPWFIQELGSPKSSKEQELNSPEPKQEQKRKKKQKEELDSPGSWKLHRERQRQKSEKKQNEKQKEKQKEVVVK
ncbi:hypothetical protein V8C86DRAFT_2593740 [Haematococcus lacustris]